MAARVGVDEQDPQQRGAIAVRVGHAEDAARPASVELGDPRCLAARVATGGVVGDDPATSASKLVSQPNSLAVDLAVGHHDPAEVAGLVERADRY